MKNKAYGVLNIKSFDEKQRIIRGVASTSSIDRAGDTIDPLGVRYSLPMPFLFHHNHEMPIGEVTSIEVTKEGILFEAKIAKIEEPGVLKNRTDEAFQSIESGLIKAVSVGFTSDDYSETKTGYHFKKWELYEISLVTIPANKDATIQTIKSLFNSNASEGIDESNQKNYAGVTAQKKYSYEGKKMKYSDQIKSLQAKMNANKAKQDELLEKSVQSGETFDGKEQEEFDALTAENEALEGQIKRFQVANKEKAASAVEIKESDSQEQANKQGKEVKNYATAKSGKKEHNFAKAARIMAAAGRNKNPMDLAKDHFGQDHAVVDLVSAFTTKAAVPVGSTSNAGFLGNLTPRAGIAISEFLDLEQDQSVISQLNIARIPFNTPWAEQTANADAYWTAEGGRKKATAITVRRDTLEPLKLACLTVLTEEMIWDSTPKADELMERKLKEAIARREDIDAFDPAKTAVVGVSPASFTNGATQLVSSGNVRTDLFNLASYVQTQTRTRAGTVVAVDDLSYQAALFAVNEVTGAPLFPDLATQSTVFGVKVVSSPHFREFADSTGGFAVAMNVNDLRIAEGEGLIVKYSDQATVFVNDDGGDTEERHLWQENLVGILVEKRINWTKARQRNSVAYMTGINWAPVA